MLFSTPIFSSWMTIVMPWAFGGTRMALDHSIEQVHIKFCKQTLCRAELGRYPLSIEIKASLLCYWQRLEQKSDNSLSNEAFIYARNHSHFYDLLNSDEIIQMHYKNEVIKNQQCVKNTRSSIKQQLQKKFSQDWFKAQNDILDSSRQKYTNKEIKKDYRSEEYLER